MCSERATKPGRPVARVNHGRLEAAGALPELPPTCSVRTYEWARVGGSTGPLT